MRLIALLASLLAVSGELSSANDVLWLVVPYVRQRENACGAATVSMILKYWQAKGYVQNVNADPDLIETDLYSGGSSGILASKVTEYLANAGMPTFVFAGTWDVLYTHLKKGRPLIVALKSSTNHYVVVVGTDREGEVLLLNDPARRKLFKISRKEFETSWRHNQNWTLLAVPES